MAFLTYIPAKEAAVFIEEAGAGECALACYDGFGVVVVGEIGSNWTVFLLGVLLSAKNSSLSELVLMVDVPLMAFFFEDI